MHTTTSVTAYLDRCQTHPAAVPGPLHPLVSWCQRSGDSRTGQRKGLPRNATLRLRWQNAQTDAWTDPNPPHCTLMSDVQRPSVDVSARWPGPVSVCKDLQSQSCSSDTTYPRSAVLACRGFASVARRRCVARRAAPSAQRLPAALADADGDVAAVLQPVQRASAHGLGPDLKRRHGSLPSQQRQLA